MKVLVALCIAFACAQAADREIGGARDKIECLVNLMQTVRDNIVEQVESLIEALEGTTGGAAMARRLRSQLKDITDITDAVIKDLKSVSVFTLVARMPWISAQVASLPLKLQALAASLAADSLEVDLQAEFGTQMLEMSKTILEQVKVVVPGLQKCVSA